MFDVFSIATVKLVMSFFQVSHQPDMSRPPPGYLPSGERMGPVGGAMPPPPPPSTGRSHLPLQEYPDQKVGEGDFNPGYGQCLTQSYLQVGQSLPSPSNLKSIQQHAYAFDNVPEFAL